MSVVFYAVEPTPFPYAGVVEQHSPGLLVRNLREGTTPILALLDHDRGQVVGRAWARVAARGGSRGGGGEGMTGIMGGQVM
jgi:hypothetical protein